jgi:SAM-dependent methyltransferase
MSEDVFERRRCSFGAVSDAYERARPDYPGEAVRWLLGTESHRTLDVGAGTGKLSRALLAAGHEVVAVEPDADMRRAFAAGLPGVPVLEGSAERLPLPDASVDAALAGQAFHWFERRLALPELARVLRARGILGVIYNLRDESVGWVAELGRIVHGEDGTGVSGAEDEPRRFGPRFGVLERRAFRHVHVLDVPGLVDLAASRSYTAVLPPAEREALLGSVRELAEAVAERGAVRLPYVTIALRARRID